MFLSGMNFQKQRRTWMVLAHREGARIFELRGPRRQLIRVEEIPNPRGALKNHDLGTDQPGRAFSSASNGVRHSLGQSVDPVEHEMDLFAKHLAVRLELLRTQLKFDRLIVSAEPRFLGRLKSHFSRPLEELITGVIPKSFINLAEAELSRRMGPYLNEWKVGSRRVA